MTDVTPLVSPDAKLVQSYTARGLRIAGSEYLGAVLIADNKVSALDVERPQDLKPGHLAGLDGLNINFLIIGAAKSAMLDAALLTELKQRGIVAEVMEIGAACRTFNVLLAEGRQVAAALIPAGPPPDKKLP
ncbi:MAG TPA: Mth938-like domain-containing protein [Patescibacteria group bacterium]|nr:Mth938-like domain-containing protein [Patescibacteria group bacterium]